MKHLFILAALLGLLFTPPSGHVSRARAETDAAGQGHAFGWGELLAAFALPNGGAVAVALDQDGDQAFVNFTYAGAAEESPLTHRMLLPSGYGRPDLIAADICGRYVQAFASWTGLETVRFVFELPADSGLCTTKFVWLPLVEK